MNIFVIWHDYEGRRIEEYKAKELAEKRCAEILAIAESSDNYGTCLDRVIEGKILQVKKIEVTSKVVFDD